MPRIRWRRCEAPGRKSGLPIRDPVQDPATTDQIKDDAMTELSKHRQEAAGSDLIHRSHEHKNEKQIRNRAGIMMRRPAPSPAGTPISAVS